MIDPKPITLGLLLIDGFALMSYASVIEPYRAANVLAGRAPYRWVHISIDGAPVRASNGATILALERWASRSIARPCSSLPRVTRRALPTRRPLRGCGGWRRGR